MEIENNNTGQFVLKKVFNDIILETQEGNKFGICMRDNTVEMSVAGSDIWYRADFDDGKIKEM